MARKIISDDARRLERRRLLVGLGIGCGVVCVGVAILLAVGYARLTAVPPPLPEAVQSSDQPNTGVSPGQGVALQAQVAVVQRAVRSRRPQPVAIDVSAEELTRQLGRDLEGQGVEDLNIYLGEGTVVAQGRTSMGDRKLYATVRLRPGVENGCLTLQIEDGQVGTLPMPKQLRDQLQHRVDESIAANPPQRTGIRLESVHVSGGRLRLQGTSMGRR